MKILSDAQLQAGVIHQEIMVGPTFLKLKFSKILAELPDENRFHIPPYIDALQISCCNLNLKTVKNLREGLYIT